ncbi:MAG: hypothetical protein ACKOOL_03960 [Novosphingobium sp.]
MKKLALFALAAIALPSAALAARGDMNLAVFIAKADALRAQGPLALMSSDLDLLKAEGRAAGLSYKQRLLAERARGRPSSCPPDDAQIEPQELLAFLKSSYPANARPRVTIRQGVADYFIRKYPCRH